MRPVSDAAEPGGCALVGIIAVCSLLLPLFLIAFATLWRLCWRCCVGQW